MRMFLKTLFHRNSACISLSPHPSKCLYSNTVQIPLLQQSEIINLKSNHNIFRYALFTFFALLRVKYFLKLFFSKYVKFAFFLQTEIPHSKLLQKMWQRYCLLYPCIVFLVWLQTQQFS
jgi:hypothetical protein